MQFTPHSTLADALTLATTGARVLVVSIGFIACERDFQEARDYPASPGATRVSRHEGVSVLHYPGGGCVRFLPGHAARSFLGWDAASIPVALLHLAPTLARGAGERAHILART